jgi:orotate phosphoribosyltransferase
MPEVVEYLESKDALEPELKQRIDDYYKLYGATE